MNLLLTFLIFILADVYCQESTQNEVAKGGHTPMVNQCWGTFDKIWVDVFLLIDTSTSMTKNGFTELMGELASSLSYLTIGQGAKETRIGLITYGKDATLIHGLEHWKSTDDVMELLEEENVNKLFRQTQGANIAAAITKAISQFKTTSHRQNVKPVLVIVGTAYTPSSGEDPAVTLANAFKLSGGTIITYNYRQPGSPAVDYLQKLASDGFSISNSLAPISDTIIPKLMEKANCFCPDPYVPYVLSGVFSPEYGCYRAPTTTATQKVAEKVCNLKHKGKLAKVENYGKAGFLMKQLTSLTGWIGLKRENSKWKWSDGSQLTDKDFMMWKNGNFISSDYSCVTMFENRTDHKYYWQAESCTRRHSYVCQIKPCGASNYCSEVFNVQRQNSLREKLGITKL